MGWGWVESRELGTREPGLIYWHKQGPHDPWALGVTFSRRALHRKHLCCLPYKTLSVRWLGIGPCFINCLPLHTHEMKNESMDNEKNPRHSKRITIRRWTSETVDGSFPVYPVCLSCSGKPALGDREVCKPTC